MKRCENCFESNSDGATHCVICGEGLEVPQAEGAAEAAAGLPDDVALEASAGVQENEDSSPDLQDDDYDHEGEEMDYEFDSTAEWVPSGHEESATDDGLPVDESQLPSAPSVAAAATSAQLSTAEDKVVVEVYHDSEPRVVYRHRVVNDLTLIGREDPKRDVFPDLDLGKLKEIGVSSRHVSRQHCRLLRQGGKYYLFVYLGSTGTQVNKELVDESRYGKRFQINVGDRLILGGKVRLKLTRQE